MSKVRRYPVEDGDRVREAAAYVAERERAEFEALREVTRREICRAFGVRT